MEEEIKKEVKPRWYATVQCSLEEREEFKACARAHELTVSKWFRDMGRKAVKKWKVSKQ